MKCILLLANYRTGSSDYSYKLSIDNSTSWYPEPHLFPERWSLLQESVDNDESFVIKFMPDQIKQYELYQQIISSNCYKIKLIRENKVDQIVSYYVASMTDIWNHRFDKFIRGDKYTVDISMEQIRTSIEVITKNDILLDNLAVKFDQELTYEKLLNNSLLGSRHIKILEPENYETVKQLITYEYDKSR
jgi:hypothetical protein